MVCCNSPCSTKTKPIFSFVYVLVFCCCSYVNTFSNLHKNQFYHQVVFKEKEVCGGSIGDLVGKSVRKNFKKGSRSKVAVLFTGIF